MVNPIADYVPYLVYLTDISNALQAVATFSTVHSFTPGEYVSFRVSPPYGMVEMNNVVARVLAIDTMSITVNVNTLTFNPFINAGEFLPYPAIVVPSSTGIIPGTATTNLQDAFDHILNVGTSP